MNGRVWLGLGRSDRTRRRWRDKRQAGLIDADAGLRARGGESARGDVGRVGGEDVEAGGIGRGG